MNRIEALRNAIAETEAWAVAASQTREPGTPTGEHWHWEWSICYTAINPDRVVDEFVECPACGSVGVSLRSAERYEPSKYVPEGLPSFVCGSSEEVPAASGAFIARNDPASVLRRCAADRKLVDLCEEANSYAESREWFQNDILTLMLEAYGIGSPE